MIRRAGVLAAVVAGAILLPGCRDKGYSQASPDDTLKTARLMVEKGDARRLTDLVYADSPQMRELLNQAGDMLGSLAELGKAVQGAFPEEVARLREEAETAAKSGQATSFVGRMVGMSSQVRRAARGQDSGPNPQEMFNKMAMELMADPYAWLTRNADRLSTTMMTDDTAAVLWDGQPVLPPLGVALTQKDGKWYFALPSQFPGASRILPKKPEEWEILGYFFAAIDQALVDMTKDVRSGKARRLDDVARMAGEKAFIPAAMIVFAYGKALESERKKGKPGG
jgi:hypothetical protein